MRMKTGFVLALLLFGTIVLNAQGGGNSQRRTVEERVKTIHEKFDSTYKFDAAKQMKIDSAFAVYYREQDKIREELRSGGERPDFETMRNKMQPAIDARDKELKALLSEEEFNKWKDQLEPTLMRRPGGGGGNRQ
jgi:periplasmic protein CpxP/Spy